jgi:hypothetical protein
MKGGYNMDNVQQAAQDEKIVLFQLVSPSNCIFVCLSVDENNNKLDVGILRR